MGTRSTVHFINQAEHDGKTITNTIASYYQQYDGYPDGVGIQVLDTLKKYPLVNGIKGYDPQANGMEELALWYVIDHKDPEKPGNLYATNEEDRQEYNYMVYAGYEQVIGSFFPTPVLNKIVVTDSDGEVMFKGDLESFETFVND